MRCGVVARPNDSGAPARRLCHAALLQVGESLRAADGLAVELPGAMLATPPAPLAGLPVVAQTETWQAYANEAPGLAAALAEQVSALAGVSPAPWLRVTRAAHGLDAEIACAPPHQLTSPGQGIALLRISATQAHPQLGAGLVCVLVPPSETEPVAERVYATAALLNEAEAREWTGVDQATRMKLLVHDGFGVWCAARRLNLGGFEWPRQGSVHASVNGPHEACTMAITREQFDALVLGLPWQRLEQMRSITRL